jgi:hypothetical protein
LAGASGGAIMLQLTRILVKTLQNTSQSTFATYFTALTIMLISFTSELVTLFGCIDFTVDVFGIKAPSVQWAEWQVTVPLM